MRNYLIFSILLAGVFLNGCDKFRNNNTPGKIQESNDAIPGDISGAYPPVSLHNENPHYFSFRGNPAILITSGEHYGSVINLDFDYIAYLDELASNGFNCTRLFTGPYVEFAGWYGYPDDQPLSPRPGRFICPWIRSSEPGYINGGNKFDLTQWDPHYFDRLKDFFNEASIRGIVVELTLFSPYYRVNGDDPDLLWKYSPFYHENNINSVGDIPRIQALSLDNGDLLDVQEAYVRKMVTELKDYDNLIYELCNEPYIQDLASIDWMTHIAQVIRDVESNFPYTHLISQNVANGASVIQNIVPGSSVFNFHYSNPLAVKLNYDLEKVIGNNETDAYASNTFLRVEAWAFILGGGGLYNNLDMSFTTNSPDGISPDGRRALLRSKLSILKNFIEGFNFIALNPDTTIMFNDSLNTISIAALSYPGHEYTIYLYKNDLNDTVSASTVLKTRIPAGKYMVTWMDPSSGEILKEDIAAFFKRNDMIVTPEFRTDIVLKLHRKGLFEI